MQSTKDTWLHLGMVHLGLVWLQVHLSCEAIALTSNIYLVWYRYLEDTVSWLQEYLVVYNMYNMHYIG
jgi:hypothetical protein